MKVIITDNYRELSRRAASIILNHILIKPQVVLGFPTGGTPIGLYQEIAREQAEKNYDFSRIRIFNLDEYVDLDPEDQNSYRSFMEYYVYSHLNVTRSRMYIPNGNAGDLDRECERYEQLLKKYPLDVQVLGIGENGHIGFNEPGSSFKSGVRVVKLAANTRKANSRFFGSLSQVPTHALTMGIQNIMDAKSIILLASGEKKAKAVAQLVEGKKSTACPASALQDHKEVTLIIDKEAASQLTKIFKQIEEGLESVRLVTPQILPTKKSIVVISPHPDDSSISAGGIIAGLTKHNKVTNLVMTSGYRAIIPDLSKPQRIKLRKAEAALEAKVLGAKMIFANLEYYSQGEKQLPEDIKKVQKIIKELNPDIIFIPHKYDAHPTHQLARRIVIEALRAARARELAEVWEYEGPWALFTHEQFNTVYFFNQSLMNKKLLSVRAHKSQVKRTRFHEATKILARFRNILIPEQRISGLGGNGPHLGEFAELYNVNLLKDLE